MPPVTLRRLIRPRWLAAVAFGCATAAAQPAETRPAAPTAKAAWDLPEFVAQLPELLAERLPGFDPQGAVRLYVRPHFGDFIHRDYLRVPVGARAKISKQVETSAELQSYFTHGLRHSAGQGLSGLQLGAKCEHVLPSLGNGGVSVGANFQTPLGRPPPDLTDGHRHFQPYAAATYPLADGWHLLGFASVAGDFLNRTALPAHFAKNQLHANSLTFSAGAAREWPRFHASLTASATTSALTSDESRSVFALRPEVIVPWRTRADARTRVLFTLGGRAVHGPDGNELGVSGSVRVEFTLGRRGPAM